MVYNLLDATGVFKTALNILLAILVLMAMITVHELGHYLVGKTLGFKINEFAIGMGPALFKRKLKSGEIFSLRILPLGGYCAFEGEDEENENPDAFNNKKPWKRILVLAAGAAMNYLLALIVIIISMNAYGQSALKADGLVCSGASAEQSIQAGDCIISVEKGGKLTEVYLTTDLISALNHSKAGEEVSVEVLRSGERKNISVNLLSDIECDNLTEINPVFDALGIGRIVAVTEAEGETLKAGDYITKRGDKPYAEAQLILGDEDFAEYLKDKVSGDAVSFYVTRDNSVGVKIERVLDDEWDAVDKDDPAAVLSYFGAKSYGGVYLVSAKYIKVGFFRSLGRSLNYSLRVGGTIFKTLGELLTGKLGLNSMGGTVTTIVQTSTVIGSGRMEFIFEIIAFIGVNLAVFNLLPIPALDGSRIVFCIIEWIRKKPIGRKVEGIIHAVGFVLIIAFAVTVDILHLI